MSVNLQDLIPVARKVNLGRGDVEVHGLDVTHIGTLLDRYGSDLSTLLPAESGDASQVDFAALVKAAPLIVNDIVAMAIDAEDQPDSVAKIPVSAKIEILTAVWELSVVDSKKLVAKLKELSEKVKSLRQEVGA